MKLVRNRKTIRASTFVPHRTSFPAAPRSPPCLSLPRLIPDVPPMSCTHLQYPDLLLNHLDATLAKHSKHASNTLTKTFENNWKPSQNIRNIQIKHSQHMCENICNIMKHWEQTLATYLWNTCNICNIQMTHLKHLEHTLFSTMSPFLRMSTMSPCCLDEWTLIIAELDADTEIGGRMEPVGAAAAWPSCGSPTPARGHRRRPCCCYSSAAAHSVAIV
jgi:hypothetical protein